MIPLISLTFILAITAIKGAAAQNATDTNQVRSVQCRRYGTYDIIYIYDNICDIVYILSHICEIIYMMSHICDMKTDQVTEGSITSTDCLAYVYVTWIYFVYRYFLLCALCFVLTCFPLFHARRQYLFSTDIFVLSLCEASFLLSHKKAFKSICYAGGTTILRQFAFY